MRLVAYLFKIDTYTFVSSGRCPDIRPEELDVGLPSTFALWNGEGLGPFYERLPLEPGGRDAFKICEILRDPWSLTPDLLLVEDVEMGLCGMASSLWRHRALARSSRVANGDCKVELIGRLTAWKERLDELASQCAARDPSEQATDFPLRAYFSSLGDDSTSALARASSLIQGATMLHHLLSLHVHADVQTLSPLRCRFARNRRRTSSPVC